MSKSLIKKRTLNSVNANGTKISKVKINTVMNQINILLNVSQHLEELGIDILNVLYDDKYMITNLIDLIDKKNISYNLLTESIVMFIVHIIDYDKDYARDLLLYICVKLNNIYDLDNLINMLK